MRHRLFIASALVALCVAGFALRLRGIGHLLPTITQLDAATVVGQVEELRAHAAEQRRLPERYVQDPLRMPFFWCGIRSARMGPVLEIFRLDDTN